jgi:hypothetical protein
MIKGSIASSIISLPLFFLEEKESDRMDSESSIPDLGETMKKQFLTLGLSLNCSTLWRLSMMISSIKQTKDIMHLRYIHIFRPYSREVPMLNISPKDNLSFYEISYSPGSMSSDTNSMIFLKIFSGKQEKMSIV